MKKIIEIDLYEKEDLVEKYNKRIVSKNLINYLIDEATYVNKNDTINIVVNNKCNLDNNCLDLIKKGLELELERNLKNYKLNNKKQFFLLIIGILFLLLSYIIEFGFVFKEVFLIIGWVPIWEVINIELFTDIKEKRKRKVLNRLLESNFEIVSK